MGVDALIKLAETMKDMTASEIVGDALLLLVGLSAFIEITPIKINPISSILKWIGSRINGEVISKVNKLDKALEAKGIRATVRRKLGSDINASCGQLRRAAMKKEEN